MKTWRATAPSNIALIKYMGKSDSFVNRATNRSLSWTLNHLQTHIELEQTDGESRWEPLPGLAELHLSEAGRTRFLAHLKRVTHHFGSHAQFIVRSGNDFPSDCGLASSASSFAALTRCAFQAVRELQGETRWIETPELTREMSALSRQGSGSSCRSFFSPWALWSEQNAEAIDLPGADWIHQVIILNSDVKDVSSSEAHRRVITSRLFEGRIERAEERLNELVVALRLGEWEQAFELCWAEFWDMHALFETSRPAFGYMTAGSLDVLNRVRQFWREHQDGPLVTMDAGPNVHLLYRADQGLAAEAIRQAMPSSARVLSSLEGGGSRG